MGAAAGVKGPQRDWNSAGHTTAACAPERRAAKRAGCDGLRARASLQAGAAWSMQGASARGAHPPARHPISAGPSQPPGGRGWLPGAAGPGPSRPAHRRSCREARARAGRRGEGRGGAAPAAVAGSSPGRAVASGSCAGEGRLGRVACGSPSRRTTPLARFSRHVSAAAHERNTRVADHAGEPAHAGPKGVHWPLRGDHRNQQAHTAQRGDQRTKRSLSPRRSPVAPAHSRCRATRRQGR